MKKIKWKKVLLLALIFVVLILAGAWFLLERQTYASVEIIKHYENVSVDNPGYTKFLDGILKYTRDGVSYLEKTGEEIWNHPCQMKKPTVVFCGETAAVYDNGGTSAVVFQKDGLKGEVKTTRPIESLSVSEQGIVAAILKDDDTPLLMCYDATGNVLVQQNASLENTGYPMDVAISHDGTTLLVSYLMVSGQGVSTRIVYYDFDNKTADKNNHQIYEKDYEGIIVPVAEYVNEKTSLLVADNGLILYEGKEEPAEKINCQLSTVCNVGSDKNLIAVLVKKVEDSTYQLQVYDLNGKLISDTAIKREYNNMKIYDGQILLYENNECSIYTKNGICKYEGEMESEILEIFPMFGLNKYMMINANGFYEIRLAK